jgi:hypothetical protein
LFQIIQECISKGTKLCYGKKINSEPNKVILVKWMDKVSQQSLKKEKRKSWFKIHGI